jgi:solute:Na+ symporter, SSS family
MPSFSWIPIFIIAAYLVITSLYGFAQTKKINHHHDHSISKMSIWSVATFLAGYTLGGGATYGVAGDTIKFGLTYMLWFPLSVSLGWIITGLVFARPYYRLKGVTVPTFLAERFDESTRLVTSIATLLYAIFVVLLEIYTLAVIIRALAPGLSMLAATVISLMINISSISFSGILGANSNNLVHTIMIYGSFSLALAVLWHAVGGWDVAITKVVANLPQLASNGVNKTIWLSSIGMGWGVAGQLLMGKAGRLGGISIVSNIAASCKSEKEAVKAFLLAGVISGIPPLLSSAVGIFSAALIGQKFSDMPVYSAIALAITQLNPIVGGLLLAAVVAAILSAFGPTSMVLSSVMVEDVFIHFFSLNNLQKKRLYPIVTIVVSIFCAIFVGFVGIQDILPFLYTTAFPCTVPITVAVGFVLYTDKVHKRSAFWAITLGVTGALVWGLVLGNPFGIPNMYVAYFIPLVVMILGMLAFRYPLRRVAFVE